MEISMAAPTKSASIPAPVPVAVDPVPKVEKPSFNDVLKGQVASGGWSESSRDLLAKCIKGGSCDDSAVLDALSAMSLSD